jgi:hypothetical protein
MHVAFGKSLVQSRHEDLLYWLRVFVVFSVLPDECRDGTSKLGHDRFLTNPFQFIIHLPLFHPTLYSLNETAPLNKRRASQTYKFDKIFELFITLNTVRQVVSQTAAVLKPFHVGGAANCRVNTLRPIWNCLQVRILGVMFVIICVWQRNFNTDVLIFCT